MPAAGIALAPGLCKSALGDGTPTRNACCRPLRSRLDYANLHLATGRPLAMPAAEALAPEFCKSALGDGTATRNACCSSARRLKSALEICT
ncbi:hypothetical protein OPV22_002474 [Ensete ventricosum]|uniref:Bifunctional inhibitor/plant lipid transfer protein/seed storage helical domain-containing protein n=1 Tax=Ensete ventricosum TaxID=4639 RepID=A0AAV8RXY2_ENSVE|nr:hypothetical protein OPV22_002474 [Ensete ventricosum]